MTVPGQFIPKRKVPGPGEKDPLFVKSGRRKGVAYEGDGLVDEDLPEKHDDPREGETLYRKTGAYNNNQMTYVRPGMRIIHGPTNVDRYPRPFKHDDVIIVPGFGCDENDLTMYYKLVEEIRALSEKQKSAKWVAWNEGCHLISKNPKNCPTYEAILKKMMNYFMIDKVEKFSTRFNWYRDSSDWKPFHNDATAYKSNLRKYQNVTVGVSFGAERELAFIHK